MLEIILRQVGTGKTKATGTRKVAQALRKIRR